MPKRKPKPAKSLPQKRHLRYISGSRKGAGNPHPHPPPVEHQFKLGNNANPGGRPKVLSSAYRQWLETINANDPEGRTNAELVARSMGLQSLKGNINAAREMRSATEGEHHEISGPDGQAIEIKAFNYATAVAPIAARPEPDSTPPGESQDSGDGSAVG